jgi:hypothetical protein
MKIGKKKNETRTKNVNTFILKRFILFLVHHNKLLKRLHIAYIINWGDMKNR